MKKDLFSFLTGKKPGMKDFFSRFKRVLLMNTRALEVITEMGEKLGGEYIFDVVYVRNSYQALSSHMLGSIEEFNLLTRNRYLIKGQFERIDRLIKAIVYESGEREDLVIPFSRLSWDRARGVGGKNARLAEIKNNLKIDVPEGFAITTRAYELFIKENGLKEKLSLINENEPGLAEIREMILNGRFPEELRKKVSEALSSLKSKTPLAVRSSAEEEDGEFSFAGQFETVLNLPPRLEEVEGAYKKVLASLFSPSAIAYSRKVGLAPGALKMAVGVTEMVDAVSAGVAYTVDPGGALDEMVITANWGLGKSVVEGSADCDVFILKKNKELSIKRAKTGKKELMYSAANGGVIQHEASPGMSGSLSLKNKDALHLGRLLTQLANYFKRPQDVEWALAKDGSFYILQSRNLRIPEKKTPPSPLQDKEKNIPIIENKGSIVQKGIASGRAFILKNPDELERVPRGAVLVARTDSPQLVRAMPYINGIITDTGTPASHMASICREFGVPSIVNAGNATREIKHGEEITLLAEDEGHFGVYAGRLSVTPDGIGRKRMEEVYEFRKKKYIMRYIAPLNLINPLTDDFTPEKCRTMHDILRFIHEKSVQALIDASRNKYGRRTTGGRLKRLELSVPAGIQVLDIGGGVRNGAGEKISFEDITSLPLKATVKGMEHPGAWQSEAVSLHVTDFLSSMIRMGDISDEGTEFAGKNVAVVSGEYLNLALRFGYHFNLVDAYASPEARNNHIYFRFVGGATDITKRSRRIQLIETVLKEYGFSSSTKGDLIIARVSNIKQEEVLLILEEAGKLIAFTRQLDALLDDDSDVERYAREFLQGRYELK
jgi:pyruvate,water dikinase